MTMRREEMGKVYHVHQATLPEDGQYKDKVHPQNARVVGFQPWVV